MKWLKLIIVILEYVIPGLAKLGKNKLVQDLEVAHNVMSVLSKDMSPVDKGLAVEKAVGNLKALQNFKKRASKKLDKAKERLYKKLF